MTRLPELEYRILAALEPGKVVAVADIVEQTGTDQSLVMAGATMLAQRGLVVVAEDSLEEFSLTDEGREAASGFPERKALVALKAAGGAAGFTELPKLLGKDDIRAEMKWLTKKGWCTRDSGVLAVSAEGEVALNARGADETLVEKLAALGQATEAELATAGVDVKAALELLKGRNELLKRKKRVSRKLSLTDTGAALKAGGIEDAGHAHHTLGGKARDFLHRVHHGIEWIRHHDDKGVRAARTQARTHRLGQMARCDFQEVRPGPGDGAEVPGQGAPVAAGDSGNPAGVL